MLGRALVRGFCPFEELRCQPPRKQGRPPAARDLCRLAEACPYGVFFNPSAHGRPPFALYVPRIAKRQRSAAVELTLFGPAWRYYPWVLRALARALDDGLGTHRERWKIQQIFRLDEERHREYVCGADLGRLPAALEPELLGLGLHTGEAQPVAVDLLSPTRLLCRGRLVRRRAEVSLALLIERILDRASSLYGNGSSDFLDRSVRTRIVADAAKVRLLKDATQWVDVPDYSARTRTDLLLGGKVGRLVYAAGAARFLPILRAGEVLHVGKNAASGCGRLRADLTTGRPAS